MMVSAVAGGARAQEPRPATEFIGLWTATRDFTPEARGVLTIFKSQGVWKASIAGFVVTVHVEGNRIRFALPGSRGSFQGKSTAP